jgi:hypothetical protein
LLNLLDAFGAFAPVREIAEKSFAFRSTHRSIDRLQQNRESLVRTLMETVTADDARISLDDLRGYERLVSVMDRLQTNTPATRAEHRISWLRQAAIPGRVITQGRSAKRLYMILSVNGEKVTAMRDDGQGATLEIGRISRIYETKYPLKDKSIEQAFFDVFEGRNKALAEPKPAYKAQTDQTFEILNTAMQGIVTKNGSDVQGIFVDSVTTVEKIVRIERDIEFLKEEIWFPFEQRARVLDHFGYLDFDAEVVTERGKWLADVRVDKPLLVGEALGRGLFENFLTATAAGFMAAVAADADRSYGEMHCSTRMLDTIGEFDGVLYDVGRIELRFGVPPVEDINISAAAAAEAWANGWEWEKLVERTQAEEGDLVRLLSRTGESLLQVGKLQKSNKAAAEVANAAAEAVLREPVR